MKSLRQYILEAREAKRAIGHFNVSNTEMISGVFNAAKKLNTAVIIGLSEGERDFVGVHQSVALVRSLRDKFDFPVFINADHTYSLDRVCEAIDAGFDSVIFDGAKLSFEENVEVTKQCVDYAKKSGRDVLVEGELGFIGQSSKVLDSIPDGVDLDSGLTLPLVAKQFVEETGVDLFAPAVGNFHGMLRGGRDPNLNTERISEIKQTINAPLVLHGASGNSDADIQNAIKEGISIVHVSTEIRVAYRKALALSLQENPDEVAPYKYLKGSVMAVEKLVEEKIRLF
ncbi:MAG: hypothetical protein A3G52_03190 [Candidatus Taylorbacteria bacterium RIFCSPLOWO2_12_FULL_43_20]|uniref:Tagatose-bisphosphate aldolase n=1 Tax=Candidatus Taylorbacteria bacterium RIFCSPLOWO2_12_FULL_43_20 TaxID=1802332 RepID=A0A1G2P3C5_9BACT|nr:MAG: hypothetical protein A2825_03655 [Candidatus Taylorbacteria bacterium RIFCSPHIGHO2_01_FULL_43_120]OHA22044.1 MAG: hypothetical protein A3B98_04040 [Candidatus Taylorbacteria bacterium RIFCSPHIGHO2_02_FULL_43_55]OHA30377.1 MAG: hypothetical protein A3E92_00735 [Candidatus Taylorbacteria bacterium RIFCSPHIGHO2_12_FULL_42_34]OHA31541.1 MAG: hypothetical protein A3B09_00760 [Candidatus Taylorbacteria bacterium RIFCSPLOWO2_01_FULL_43_83]OHA39747.1 MAG: hypothetical protein A3H58_04815 [Candi